ncbi:MAG: hypothetical protein HKN44_14510 [Ilumatobacter sp.]|nr:hypothetical protein [Ilumatobacter sp.]
MSTNAIDTGTAPVAAGPTTPSSMPSRPATTPLAPPPVAAGPAEKSPPAAATAPPLALVLDELVDVVEGVHGALLGSVDGFAIARSATMPNSAAHAAILAAGMGLAHQLAAMGGGDELRQLVIDHDQGLLLLWPIGTQRVLALLTARRVDQAHLRRFVQSRASWLAGER